MKDSFGGSIMIYIIILFLGIYIVFIALTLRYAQSFKVKNKIIDWIEQYDGDIAKLNDTMDVSEYFTKNGFIPNQYSIRMVKNNDLKNTCYYVVNTYIDWEWPFLDIKGTWDIHGETKAVSNCNFNEGKSILLKVE